MDNPKKENYTARRFIPRFLSSALIGILDGLTVVNPVCADGISN